MPDQRPELAALIDKFVEEYVALSDQIKSKCDARSLERSRSKLCRNMADALDQFEGLGNRRSGILRDPSNGRGTTLERRWVVSGVPSKKKKAAAQKWMQSIGLEWDGNAPDLRREVQAAVAHGEAAPGDWFGLSVEWTVHVERNEVLEKSLDRIQAYFNDKQSS